MLWSAPTLVAAISQRIQQTNSALLQAHVVIRKDNQADSMGIRALTARAQNAERRAINLQNQLLQSEEKLTVVNQKTAVADNKWEARVKEYETRLKVAEEKVKREKQGFKERVVELETQIKYVIPVGLLYSCRAASQTELLYPSKGPCNARKRSRISASIYSATSRRRFRAALVRLVNDRRVQQYSRSSCYPCFRRMLCFPHAASAFLYPTVH